MPVPNNPPEFGREATEKGHFELLTVSVRVPYFVRTRWDYKTEMPSILEEDEIEGVSHIFSYGRSSEMGESRKLCFTKQYAMMLKRPTLS